MKTELNTALKNRESIKVSVLRMLVSEIHNVEINKKRELSEREIVGILMASAKKHRDSISQFEGAGRDDLATREKSELEIIQSYLPEFLSERELLELIKKTVEEAQASSPADFGKVMKLLMPKIKGRAEGSLVSDGVKKILERENVTNKET